MFSEHFILLRVRREAGYTLDRGPVHHRPTIIQAYTNSIHHPFSAAYPEPGFRVKSLGTDPHTFFSPANSSSSSHAAQSHSQTSPEIQDLSSSSWVLNTSPGIRRKDRNNLNWPLAMQMSSNFTLRISQMTKTLTQFITVRPATRISVPPLVLTVSFFLSRPTVHDYWWGLERRSTGKSTALLSNSALSSPHQTDAAYASL